MYAIRNAGAKGLGVFAVKNIKRGTRILAERPLLSLKSERDAYKASLQLPPDDRTWFLTELTLNKTKARSVADLASSSWNLLRSGIWPSAAVLAEHDAALAVFKNNNYDIGGGTQWLLRDCSRLNHACVPNSQGNMNTAAGQFCVHAVKPINEGDEVTVSYMDEFGGPRESRQRSLYESHGFTCACPICDSTTELGRRTEARRTEVSKKIWHFAEQAQTRSEPDIEGELRLVRTLIESFEADGLAGRELSTM